MSEKEINLSLILEGCKNGNPHSQEKLYKNFYGYAMSICLRYSKSRYEAREILNDSFLKVFNKLHQYDKDFPFNSWLRRILINTAIDFYRTKQRHPLFVPIKEAHFISDENGEDFAINPSVNTLPILQKLSPAYRIVFNLYVMEGYKHHEIAEQLGISVSTSKTNLARAKARLKTLILEENTQKKIKLNRHG